MVVLKLITTKIVVVSAVVAGGTFWLPVGATLLVAGAIGMGTGYMWLCSATPVIDAYNLIKQVCENHKLSNVAISEDSTDEEVLWCKKRLSQAVHPDRHGGSTLSTEEMQRVNDAFDTIQASRMVSFPTFARMMSQLSCLPIRRKLDYKVLPSEDSLPLDNL